MATKPRVALNRLMGSPSRAGSCGLRPRKLARSTAGSRAQARVRMPGAGRSDPTAIPVLPRTIPARVLSSTTPHTDCPATREDAMRWMSRLGHAVLLATCSVVALVPPATAEAQGHLTLYCSPQIEWCQ